MRKKNLKDHFDDELRVACEGMTYISEIDAELMPVNGGKIKEATIREYLGALGVDAGEKIQTIPFDRFFERLIKKNDWHGTREIENGKKWLRMKTLLEENLLQLQVIRVGAVRIDIYILGRDKKGNVAGVKTKAVET